MRNINIRADAATLTPDVTAAGYAGEHLSTALHIALDDMLAGEGYEYRLVLQTAQQRPRRDGFVTDLLQPEAGTLAYTLPNCVMVQGTLGLQLRVYEPETGKLLYTPCCTPALAVGASLVRGQEQELHYNGLLEEHIAALNQFAAAADSAAQGANTAAELALDAATEAETRTSQVIENTNAAAAQATEAANDAKTATTELRETLGTDILTDEVYAEYEDQANMFLAAIAGGSGLTVTSWRDAQQVTRLGLAGRMFGCGGALVCGHSKYGTLTWDIIGNDQDVPSDPALSHALPLQLRYLPEMIQFDGAEALYSADEALPAGTYNFTLQSGWDVDWGGGKTYQFTLSQPLPAGGQIVWPWGYHQQALEVQVITYASWTSTTPIETVPVTEGNGGTALESIGGCNSTQRIRYGNGAYILSAERQWINSAEKAGNVWHPQHKYDRPPNWADTLDGFLCGIDPDFLEVIGTVKKTTKLANYDGGGIITTDERFFLLSRSEVFGDDDGIEGAPYPFFSARASAATNGPMAARIKYKDGVARDWHLRTPGVATGYSTMYVLPDGSIDNAKTVINPIAVAPACCIV